MSCLCGGKGRDWVRVKTLGRSPPLPSGLVAPPSTCTAPPLTGGPPPPPEDPWGSGASSSVLPRPSTFWVLVPARGAYAPFSGTAGAAAVPLAAVGTGDPARLRPQRGVASRVRAATPDSGPRLGRNRTLCRLTPRQGPPRSRTSPPPAPLCRGLALLLRTVPRPSGAPPLLSWTGDAPIPPVTGPPNPERCTGVGKGGGVDRLRRVWGSGPSGRTSGRAPGRVDAGASVRRTSFHSEGPGGWGGGGSGGEWEKTERVGDPQGRRVGRLGKKWGPCPHSPPPPEPPGRTRTTWGEGSGRP